ncbi:hypothetical protein GCM10009836_68260 [Pseudonocardia ailaonensis]|uniref:Uncharacterized protein n=1 Tax=Pseudonocardia ailaonensis TaxID=367279 RepID=A0ABN2NRD5_9PSEU
MSETGENPVVPQGPVRTLVLVGAGLAVVVYLLGFFGDGLSGALTVGPVLLVGGLLAGAVLLPRAGKLLVPSAVLSVVGFLVLLQVVVVATRAGLGGILIVSLVLSFLQAAALTGAVLLDSGLVTMPAPRPAAPPQGYGPPGQPYGYGGYPPPQQGGGYVQQQQPQYGQYGYQPSGAYPQQYGGYPGQQPYGGPGQPPTGAQPVVGQPYPGAPAGQPATGSQQVVGGAPGAQAPSAQPAPGQSSPGQPPSSQPSPAPGQPGQSSGAQATGGQASGQSLAAQAGGQQGAPSPLWSAQTESVAGPTSTGNPLAGGQRPADLDATRVDGTPVPADPAAQDGSGRHERPSDSGGDRTTRIQPDPDRSTP